MTTAEKRKKIQQAKELLTKLYSKYITEGVIYRRLGASEAAINANRRRQELTSEALQILGQVEQKYMLEDVKQRSGRLYVAFHFDGGRL